MINESRPIFNSPASFCNKPSLISEAEAKAYVDQLIKDLGMPSYQTVTVDSSGKIIIQGFVSLKYFEERYPEIDPGPALDSGDDVLADLKMVLSPESSEIVCGYWTKHCPWNDQIQTFQIEYLGYPTGSVTP